MEFMETPCVDICQIDRQTRLCRGCARSIEEITMWASLTDEERRRIMSELDARKLSLNAATGSGGGR
jgi:predicted Fe-S protein YdhL (DUF1289 family)